MVIIRSTHLINLYFWTYLRLVVKVVGYCSAGMLLKQIRYVRHPLRHMGNTRVK